MSIKRLREDRNLTQGELAQLTGIAQPDISSLEAGNRPLFPSWAKRLSKALRVSMAELYKADEELR